MKSGFGFIVNLVAVAVKSKKVLIERLVTIDLSDD